MDICSQDKTTNAQKYEGSLHWLSYCKRLNEGYRCVTDDRIRILNDMVVNSFYLGVPYQQYRSELLELADSISNPHTKYVVCYNVLVLSILTNSIRQSDYKFCMKVMQGCNRNDPVYLGLSILRAWMLGYIYGHEDAGLFILRSTLRNVHDVFNEDDDTVASAYYCHAVLSWMLGDYDNSMISIGKAISLSKGSRQSEYYTKLYEEFKLSMQKCLKVN